MKQIYPDLWQTSLEHPFGPQMSTHAYLLTRGTGSVLFYSSGHSIVKAIRENTQGQRKVFSAIIRVFQMRAVALTTL